MAWPEDDMSDSVVLGIEVMIGVRVLVGVEGAKSAKLESSGAAADDKFSPC